jgi:CHAD domain-containing protein
VSRPLQTHLWLLPGRSSVVGLHKKLQSIDGLNAGNKQNVQILFLDSFDWRLYQKGWTLQASQLGEEWLLNLIEAATGKLLGVSPVASLPRFIDDVPSDVLYKKLYSALSPRALLTVCELRLKRHEYVYLNKEGKQYLRLFLDQPRAFLPKQPQAKKLPNWLIVEPTRGYEKKVDRFINLLAKQLNLEECGSSLLAPCLTATGVEPSFKVSKYQISLDNDEPIHQALKRILLSLLEKIYTNEAGLIERIDTEFLHDYRVAIRCIRSLLEQVKNVIPQNKLEELKNDFAWLSTLTGPARDYDVMLLEFPEYQAMLVKYDFSDIAGLRDYLQHKREETYNTLIKALQSKRYANLKQRCRDILETDDPTLWEGGSQLKVTEFANKRIHKIYKRVISEGRNIEPESPIETFHELRKSCKKLRYLMEMFRDLYPYKKVKILIKALKNLQNNLGELQDLEVHAEILQNFLIQQVMDKGNAQVPGMEVRQLIERMNSQKQTLMKCFHSPFSSFASKQNKKLFAELFELKNT